jgi:hypothetical protein
MHPPSAAWANYSLMMEFMPESGHCHSVYFVDDTAVGTFVICTPLSYICERAGTILLYVQYMNTEH